MWYLLLPALFLIACAYASVGLGGGTAYLSIISFWNADPHYIRPMAWVLNIIAAGVSFWNFRAKGHFRPAEVWPYLLGGIVGAWTGAALPIKADVFRAMLGAVLLLVSLDMFFMFFHARESGGQATLRHLFWPVSVLIGFGVGAVSGLVGIGGGIILGPVILTLKLGEPKPVAALTSLFIVLTSASALGSHLASGRALDLGALVPAAVVVLAGAFIGSRYGAGKASPILLRRIFAVLVFVAGVNLLAPFLPW